MPSPLDLLVPGLGEGISLASTVVSGIEEAVAAAQQKKQAANLRSQANRLPVEQLRPEFKQKLQADQMVAQGGLPGLELYKQQLAANSASYMRTIRSFSPSGSAALEAASAALGQQNIADNKLAEQNAGYMADTGKEVRNDIWNIGLQQRALEQYRNQERDKMFAQANNLETAGTQNKQTGINAITGGIGSTATGFAKTVMNQDDKTDWKSIYDKIFNSNAGKIGNATVNPAGMSIGTGSSSFSNSPGQTTQIGDIPLLLYLNNNSGDSDLWQK